MATTPSSTGTAHDVPVDALDYQKEKSDTVVEIIEGAEDDDSVLKEKEETPGDDAYTALHLKDLSAAAGAFGGELRTRDKWWYV